MTLPNVTVTTGPTSKSVTQRATVKTELGISGTGQDARIDRLIDAVSAAFAGPDGIQRPPWRQTYSESRPGDGGIYLSASIWPIESVSSITLGGDTVTASTYSIKGEDRDRVYSSSGWAKSGVDDGPDSGFSGDRDLDYVIAYIGGWLMPGEVTEWAASTAVSAAGWMKSTSTVDRFLFQATAAGTTGSTEPTWPTTEAGTVADNDLTWTAKPAQELPSDIQEAAIITTIDWLRGGLQIPSGIKSEAFDTMRREYVAGGSPAFPEAARRICRRYR